MRADPLHHDGVGMDADGGLAFKSYVGACPRRQARRTPHRAVDLLDDPAPAVAGDFRFIVRRYFPPTSPLFDPATGGCGSSRPRPPSTAGADRRCRTRQPLRRPEVLGSSRGRRPARTAMVRPHRHTHQRLLLRRIGETLVVPAPTAPGALESPSSAHGGS